MSTKRVGNKVVPFITFNQDNLIDCFGIQPIFAREGTLEKSNVFSIERQMNPKIQKIGTIRYRLYNDEKEIKRNLIPYEQLRSRLLNLITNTRRFYFPTTIDDFIKLPTKTMEDHLKTNAFYMYYWNQMHFGNRFISSNKDLLDSIKIARGELQYKKILVQPHELLDHCLIVACKGSTIADNGIILSPIINRDHYLEWLDNKGYSEDIPINHSERYPLLRKWGVIFGYYEEYINENVPKLWHISKSKKYNNFYTTLVFKE